MYFSARSDLNSLVFSYSTRVIQPDSLTLPWLTRNELKVSFRRNIFIPKILLRPLSYFPKRLTKKKKHYPFRWSIFLASTYLLCSRCGNCAQFYKITLKPNTSAPNKVMNERVNSLRVLSRNYRLSIIFSHNSLSWNILLVKIQNFCPWRKQRDKSSSALFPRAGQNSRTYLPNGANCISANPSVRQS